MPPTLIILGRKLDPETIRAVAKALGDATDLIDRQGRMIAMLTAAAEGASHLLSSLLAVRDGAGDELIESVRQSLDTAIAAAKEGV